LCDTHLERYGEAIGTFQRVIDAQREEAHYFESVLNQAAARILAGGENNLSTAEASIRLVLASQDRLRSQMPEDEGRKLLIGARVNLAGLLEKTKRPAEAIEQFEVALNESMTHEKGPTSQASAGVHNLIQADVNDTEHVKPPRV
jgi:tetratricopeptide (TPR) repeat protein